MGFKFPYWFPFIVFIVCINQACNSTHANQPPLSEKDLINKTDTFTYQVYQEQNQYYGFDILLNGKVYIHQPIIPCKEGLNGFVTASVAQSVAGFLTTRLKDGNYRFLIKEYEIDSLLQLKDNNHKQLQPGTKIIRKNDTLTHSYTIINELNNEPGILLPLPDAPVKNMWRRLGVVPFGSRGGGLCFSIQHQVFIGGGQLKDETLNDFWCYNTLTQAWTCMAFLPGGNRISCIAFAIGNKGYMGLGYNGGGISKTFKKDFYEYNPEKNIWTARAEFLGTARVDASSFVIDDLGYVGTGYDAEGYCSDFYQYNPLQDSWKRVADFAEGPVSSSIGISTGTKGFIVAGDRIPYNKKFIYEYLPKFNRWEKRKDFPGHARYFLAGWGIDSNLLIAGVGGAEGGAFRFRDFFMYNVSDDNWSRINDYPASKAGNSRPCGGNVNGKIFSGTGFDGAYRNDWNVYEYFYPVRTDTGLYDEGVCYPLTYNNTWQLFEECSDECYAGAATKSAGNIGNICYKSYLTKNIERLTLNDSKGIEKKFIILPRRFYLSSEKDAKDSVGLRLFYTKDEIKNFAASFEKETGKTFNVSMLRILQNKNGDNLQLKNTNANASNYSIITTLMYGYGYNQQIYVASINLPRLNGDFYLALELN